MKLSSRIWFAGSYFIVWMSLAWFLGSWLGLKSPTLLWILRSGLALIGIAGLLGLLLLRRAGAELSTADDFGDPERAIDDAFRQAAERLHAGKSAKQISSMPIVCFLGDRGAAKTTCIVSSRMHPELLTNPESEADEQTLSVWYARQSIFVDPAGSVMANAKARRRLFSKLRPAARTASAGAGASIRSAVLVFDCGWFLKPGADAILQRKARQYRRILAEMARAIGTALPVYVMFSKADKIPCFSDFFERLSEAEAGEVLGVSLPVFADESRGEFEHYQKLRLNEAFQRVRQSLTDRRPLHLARVQDTAKIASTFEFPREFQKLRPGVVGFLTDLCRPVQSGRGPLLRGFYFTGERQSDARGAQRWIFIKDLLRDVFLADAAGSSMVQSGPRVGLPKRMAMASAAAASLCVAGWLTDSYSQNSALLQNAIRVSQSVPWLGLTAQQQVSRDTLLKLSEMRETLAKLDTYERTGAPWNYRGLLYKGNAIREPLRVAYYSLFRRTLLEPAQQALVEICKNPKKYDKQGYAYVYDALKSYLITTSRHEMSNPEFLAASLTRHWRSGQRIDKERENLARQNFEFYSKELTAMNPYPQFDQPDLAAVENAKNYLSDFLPDGDTVTRLEALFRPANANPMGNTGR